MSWLVFDRFRNPCIIWIQSTKSNLSVWEHNNNTKVMINIIWGPVTWSKYSKACFSSFVFKVFCNFAIKCVFQSRIKCDYRWKVRKAYFLDTTRLCVCLHNIYTVSNFARETTFTLRNVLNRELFVREFFMMSSLWRHSLEKYMYNLKSGIATPKMIIKFIIEKPT